MTDSGEETQGPTCNISESNDEESSTCTDGGGESQALTIKVEASKSISQITSAGNVKTTKQKSSPPTTSVSAPGNIVQMIKPRKCSKHTLGSSCHKPKRYFSFDEGPSSDLTKGHYKTYSEDDMRSQTSLGSSSHSKRASRMSLTSCGSTHRRCYSTDCLSTSSHKRNTVGLSSSAHTRGSRSLGSISHTQGYHSLTPKAHARRSQTFQSFETVADLSLLLGTPPTANASKKLPPYTANVTKVTSFSNISHAMGYYLKKQMSEPDLKKENSKLEQVLNLRDQMNVRLSEINDRESFQKMKEEMKSSGMTTSAAAARYHFFSCKNAAA